MEWNKNPDELIARFRKRNNKTPLVVVAEPIVWDVVGGADEDCSKHAALLLRPWEGEILLSLGTVGSAPQALLRRPWLLIETEEGDEPVR